MSETFEVPPPPAKSPQDLIAAANWAEYVAEMLAFETLQAAPAGAMEIMSLPVENAETLAYADDAAITACAERDAGLAGWDAHHEAARAAAAAEEQARHEARLRYVYREQPEVLAALGIAPEPAVDVVGYPQAQREE